MPATSRLEGSAVAAANVAAAHRIAAALPALLVEARRIAATILVGWHGRSRAGPGETFWQFRPFASGEPAAAIDWRRSARDDHLHVRETEWEAAHTIWLSPDLSPSMDFRSGIAPIDKASRSVVLTLAIAELLAEAGERIGLLGSSRAVLSRRGAERLAADIALGAPPSDNLALVRPGCEAIVLSDFLDPIEDVEARLDALAAAGAKAHLVQILDPVEETFPYSGRVAFDDPETGQRHLVGRAETMREAYRKLMAERRDRIAGYCRRLGWTYLVHHTDRPAIAPVADLHRRLTDRGAFADRAQRPQ